MGGEKVTRGCDVYGGIGEKGRMKMNKFMGKREGDSFMREEQG